MTTYLNSNQYYTTQVDSYDNDIIKPMFGIYQLLGDSLFVRFAEKILQQRIYYVNGARSVGLCISGQRIDQLREKIESNYYQVTKRVMILIGTNDVLSGGDIYVMMKHFKKLLKETQKHAEEIVILTLPPIPRLCVTYMHWTLIRKYNYFLKSLSNGRYIRVIDVCDIFTRCKSVFSYSINYENVLNHRKFLSVKKIQDRKKTDIIKGIKRKADSSSNISDIHNPKLSHNSVRDVFLEIKRKKMNCTETEEKVDDGSRHIVEFSSGRSMDKDHINPNLREGSRFVDNVEQKKKCKKVGKNEGNKHKDDYHKWIVSKLYDSSDDENLIKNVKGFSDKSNDSNNNIHLERDKADNENMNRRNRTDEKSESPRIFLKCLQEVTGKSYLDNYQKKLVATDLNWSVLDEEEEEQKSVKMLGCENWSDNDDNNEPEWKRYVEIKTFRPIPIDNGKGDKKDLDGDSNKNSVITEKMQYSSDSESDETNFRFRPQMKGYVDMNFLNFIQSLPDFKAKMARQNDSRLSGKYNNELKYLSEKDRKIFEYSEVICYTDYYEKFFGNNYNKIDMIHLNYRGLDKLNRFLLENKLVNFKK